MGGISWAVAPAPPSGNVPARLPGTTVGTVDEGRRRGWGQLGRESLEMVGALLIAERSRQAVGVPPVETIHHGDDLGRAPEFTFAGLNAKETTAEAARTSLSNIGSCAL